MILIFGGTTEGRIVSSVLDESGKEYYYSTKGAFQEVDLVHGERVSGAMTHEVMRDFIREKDIHLVVDAAHPFAAVLHKTIGEVTAELASPSSATSASTASAPGRSSNARATRR